MTDEPRKPDADPGRQPSQPDAAAGDGPIDQAEIDALSAEVDALTADIASGTTDQRSAQAERDDAASPTSPEPAATETPAEPAPSDGDASIGDDAVVAAAQGLTADIESTMADAVAAVDASDESAAAEMAAAIAAEVSNAVTSGGADPVAARNFVAPDLSPAKDRAAMSNIDLLDDVELDVKIELGRTEMYIEDVLQLGVGSVVPLDKAAGDPVDIYVNDRRVARGEVLVLNDNFCVRINDIVSSISELDEE